MKCNKLILIGIFLLTLPIIFATNSTNYQISDAGVVFSGGGYETNSSSYSTDAIPGIISGNTTSASYNQKIGFLYSKDTTAPVITLINPSDGLSTTSATRDFDFNVTETSTTNCSLIIDSSIITSNSSVNVTGGTNTLLPPSFSVTSHSWSINCTDSAGNTGNSSTRTLTRTTLTTTAAASGTGGGGGGGGGAAPLERTLIANIETNPEVVSIDRAVGVSGSTKLRISNIGDLNLDVNVTSSPGLSGIININEKFFLKVGEEYILEFDVITPDKPDIYSGIISIKAADKLLEIPFLLNVQSEKSLFDISTYISDEYKRIEPGEKLKHQITLIQMGLQENMDVTINYVVKDFRGNTYIEESETIAVLNQKSYEHEFQTQNLQSGNYFVGVEVVYPGGVATASAQFQIGGIEEKESYSVLIGTLFVLISVFILLIILIKKYKSHHHKLIRR